MSKIFNFSFIYLWLIVIVSKKDIAIFAVYIVLEQDQITTDK